MSTRHYDNVIVFGASGAVGSSAALEAEKRGAKVWLATRDTTKPTKTISADTVKSGNFVRIQADASDPASVSKAVAESQAKAAFVYLVQESMRGTLQALRDGGVENIVFLSSYTVAMYPEGLETIPPQEVIPYAHAQAEIAIAEVGFPYVTALRPGRFASNWLRTMLDRAATPPRAIFISPNLPVDNIVPEDIGAVAGATLVERPSDGKEVILLVGPENKTMGECWKLVKKITGREDLDITPLTRQEVLDTLLRRHMPPPLANYIATGLDEKSSTEDDYTQAEWYGKAVSNVKKYAGKDSTKFEDYLETQKSEWQAL